MSDGGGTAAPAAATVVLDQDIAEELLKILHVINPNAVNLNGVVQQLESKLGLDLSHKLDFIRSQINHFFLQLQAQAQAQAQILHQHQQQQLKDHFALHQNPNFQPSPHFPANFTVHRPEEYSFRPPSQSKSQSQPQPPPLQQQQQPLPAVAHSTSQPVLVAPKASASPPAKKRRGGPGGLTKMCGVTPELQTIVGHPTLPRTEIVKQLWAYIRKNNLQDPNNKRKIICNDELRLVFETDCTDMFKMNKLLSKHIITLDTNQIPKKAKVEVESGSENIKSVGISEALASFFGTDERVMSQAEVLRQVWEYIKVNQLEDPLNSMAILCDAKLQELFGCESISALGIPEMLASQHLSI